jgi:HD-GYP domain-containing protein (c-di-GMP phosphodiesterase class II)
VERRELDRIRPGDVLGRTILDDLGRPLLRAGTTITPEYLEGLRRHGLLSIYVRDGLADDVVPRDAVSHRVRSTLAGHVADTFGKVSLLAFERGRGAGSAQDAIDDLGEQPLPVDDAEDLIGRLIASVEQLLDEIMDSSAVDGLDALKTHNNYTFEHSVDVAVIGALLGTRLGMPRPRLRELALGCLLHDIGKMYIDTAILDKPGKLTAEEFGAVQEHPRMGFELIRRMPVASLLPAHVAYQHHEQQHGGGYPRGLVGRNTIGPRLTAEDIGAGRMLLIAEIGAVADVYSALASDRPYRGALATDAIADELDRMAGRHLNAELVRTLRRLVPRFPVGQWVEVTAGAHQGYRGVVTEVHRRDVDRPTVRLVLDERGEQLRDPREVDLRDAIDVQLRTSTVERVLA